MVVFWEEKGFQRYLGVVDNFDEKRIPLESYMIRSSTNDSEWVFPKKTTTEQIITRKVPAV